MRNHPLTPMTDSSLVRVLRAQSEGEVGLIAHNVVARGKDAIRSRIEALRQERKRFAIVDVVDDEDLSTLGVALADAPLVVAGSGLAIGLPQNFGIFPSPAAALLPPATGARAIVSGSCSLATNRQVHEFLKDGGQAFRVDPMKVAAGQEVVQEALAWSTDRLGDVPVLIYSSSPPDEVQAIQDALGVSDAGNMIEQTLAAIGQGLIEKGVRQLVVAGGETSGAIVQALGITQLRIGSHIDPGVPWCYASPPSCREGMHVALKSGNFGTADFFTKSFARLS